MVVPLSGCPLETWSSRLADASAPDDRASVDASDVADVADADVADVADADFADVADADVADSADADVADGDARDGDVADADADVADADADVADADADADVAVGCSAEAPTRCGASCCAGPCNGEACDALAGVTGNYEATCAWTVAGRMWCWSAQTNYALGPRGVSLPPRALATLADVVQVSMNVDDVCAVLRDGSLRCWNSFTAPMTVIPASATPASRVVEVAVGGYFTCARFQDGHVECRGNNRNGQLGRGFIGMGDAGDTDAFAPVRLEGGEVLRGAARIGAGIDHACALLADRTVRCWGSDNEGQLGDNLRSPRACGDGQLRCSAASVAVPGLSEVTVLAVGPYAASAARADGTVWSWGRSDGATIPDAAPPPPDDAGMAACSGIPCATVPTRRADLSGVEELVVGVTHVCALRRGATADGGAGPREVVCWGTWEHGLTPAGGERLRVIAGFGAQEPRILGGGIDHACAITASNGLLCWGDNSLGQIADGRGAVPFATAVAGLAGVAQVAAGQRHTCALVGASRSVQCWGDNRLQQLSDDTRVDRPAPTAALLDGLRSPVEGAQQVAAGARHTCARTATGELLCWGDAHSWQLGQVSSMHVESLGARPLRGVSGVASVAPGGAFTCVQQGASVACWGRDDDCQTARGGADGGVCPPPSDDSEDPRPTTVPLPAMFSLAGVTAGARHACAWGASATTPVVCWGANVDGQSTGDSAVAQVRPTGVTSTRLVGVREVSAGGDQTCAVLADRRVECWGDNTFGALGRFPGEGSSPEVVAGLADVTRVRVGGGFACALRGDRTVVCWGRNDQGQLGDGSSAVQRHAPQPVLTRAGAPLADVSDLAVGEAHACAVVGGAVWCWGADHSGQTGDRNPSVRLDAVPVRW